MQQKARQQIETTEPPLDALYNEARISFLKNKTAITKSSQHDITDLLTSELRNPAFWQNPALAPLYADLKPLLEDEQATVHQAIEEEIALAKTTFPYDTDFSFIAQLTTDMATANERATAKVWQAYTGDSAIPQDFIRFMSLFEREIPAVHIIAKSGKRDGGADNITFDLLMKGHSPTQDALFKLWKEAQTVGYLSPEDKYSVEKLWDLINYADVAANESINPASFSQLKRMGSLGLRHWRAASLSEKTSPEILRNLSFAALNVSGFFGNNARIAILLSAHNLPPAKSSVNSLEPSASKINGRERTDIITQLTQQGVHRETAWEMFYRFNAQSLQLHHQTVAYFQDIKFEVQQNRLIMHLATPDNKVLSVDLSKQTAIDLPLHMATLVLDHNDPQKTAAQLNALIKQEQKIIAGQIDPNIAPPKDTKLLYGAERYKIESASFEPRNPITIEQPANFLIYTDPVTYKESVADKIMPFAGAASLGAAVVALLAVCRPRRKKEVESVGSNTRTASSSNATPALPKQSKRPVKTPQHESKTSAEASSKSLWSIPIGIAACVTPLAVACGWNELLRISDKPSLYSAEQVVKWQSLYTTNSEKITALGELGGASSNVNQEWSQEILKYLREDPKSVNYQWAVSKLQQAGILNQGQTIKDLDLKTLPQTISDATKNIHTQLSNETGIPVEQVLRKISTSPDFAPKATGKSLFESLNTYIEKNGPVGSSTQSALEMHDKIAGVGDTLPQGITPSPSNFNALDFHMNNALAGVGKFAQKAADALSEVTHGIVDTVIHNPFGVTGLVMSVSQFASNMTHREKAEKLTVKKIQENFTRNLAYNSLMMGRIATTTASVAGYANPLTGTVSAALYISMQATPTALKLATEDLENKEAAVRETHERRVSGKSKNIVADTVLEYAVQGSLKNVAFVNTAISQGLNIAAQEGLGVLKNTSQACLELRENAPKFTNWVQNHMNTIVNRARDIVQQA